VAASAHAELLTGIKAVVHDSLVTYQEVEMLTMQTADVLARKYAQQPAEFEKKMNEARSENLERQMDRQFILHEFKAAGYNLPESILEEQVQERIRAEFGDQTKMTRTLQAQGLTRERFRQQMRDRIIIDFLRYKNVSSEIIISPHKIEAYYLAHRDDYKLEDEVKLRMIVLHKNTPSEATSAKALAEDIDRKLAEGASFEEMARVYSQGSQRDKGGDWGWVERSVLRKELADVAFTLKPGERSKVIDNPEACYLMLAEDTRGSHYKTLGEVRDQIEKNLAVTERARLEKQWIESLKKKTFHRYF
jgi:parvulin-like peptidyl-prolyl isomerase